MLYFQVQMLIPEDVSYLFFFYFYFIIFIHNPLSA